MNIFAILETDTYLYLLLITDEYFTMHIFTSDLTVMSKITVNYLLIEDSYDDEI